MGLLGTVDTPEIDSHNGQWENYTNGYSIPSGTRYITYSMEFKRYVGTDLDAFVDDNSLVIDGPSGTTPEPGTFVLLGSALSLVGVVRRKLIYRHAAHPTRRQEQMLKVEGLNVV
jgi:hypothetical protein